MILLNSISLERSLFMISIRIGTFCYTFLDNQFELYDPVINSMIEFGFVLNRQLLSTDALDWVHFKNKVYIYLEQ